MFIRKNWLPLSVFLIAIVMVGLYVLQTRPEKTPIKIDKAVEVEKPKAEVPTGETSQGGHFHADGTFHAQPHEPAAPATVVEPRATVEVGGYYGVGGELIAAETISPGDDIFVAFRPPAGVGPDWASMSPETLARFIKGIEEHRIDAPEGYDYKRTANEWRGKWRTALLDENGYPVLHKRGEPFFSIIWNPTGFRPTPEQYAEYKKLGKKYMELRAETVSSPELDRLVAQMEEMERTYVGPVPDATGSNLGGMASGPPETFDQRYKAYLEKYAPIRDQLTREAYQKAGLGYMKE